ncbi:TetR/AcrR family transcriptional regulator [Streptomyces gobiensis]|uniref:TetR/AcrR family transcriptional regulator n=1 Tax=Streptomyces gobiensis TaxID=2875706 RepID=UPI001E62FFB9|nr:TetR family transcriptional regulator [Streptomyces gobiensis]UGY91183.1 TetR family transcriptional regulator [Streptomyces gobiensis]
MAGLRERKKQRTRDALIRAAHELFVSQGYEQTPVDEIAAEVDVSQRTFFRYFANKEEAAFAIQEMVQERYFTAVLERPEHEAPMTALRGALDDGWDTIGEAIQEVVPLELHLRMWQVIETTPALVAVHLRRSMELEERLSVAIAERAGVDVNADPRPRVLVAAFSAVMRVAMHRWGLSEDLSIEGARRRTHEYLDQLGPALVADWYAGSHAGSCARSADDSTR